jgi:hypothetical protein
MQELDLEDFFSTARRQTVDAPPDLMTRVLLDAQAVQPRAKTPVSAPRPGFWAQLLAGIGGAPALAGLSTAMLAGLWIGFAQPVALSNVTDVFLAGSTVIEPLDVIPAFDDFVTEG